MIKIIMCNNKVIMHFMINIILSADYVRLSDLFNILISGRRLNLIVNLWQF